MTHRSAADLEPERSRTRWRRGIVVLVVILALAGALSPSTAQAQGRPFSLEGLQGGSLGPDEFAQGVIIAVVWASWSPHCRDIVPRVDRIVETWGAQAKVVLVDFQEDRGEVEAFLAGKRPKAPVFLDASGAFSKKHSVTNLPGMVIFKDGAVAFSGKLPRNPDSVISQTLR